MVPPHAVDDVEAEADCCGRRSKGDDTSSARQITRTFDCNSGPAAKRARRAWFTAFDGPRNAVAQRGAEA